MNGNEFLKRIEKASKNKGLVFRFDESHGKGSHGRVWVGDKFTTLKDRRNRNRSRPFDRDASRFGVY